MLSISLQHTSREMIRPAVMLNVRFLLSLRNVEDLLYELGIEISHETVWTLDILSWVAAMEAISHWAAHVGARTVVERP